MVTINLAYTAPINPSGATPTLTAAQVWTGLQRKVRAAHNFVPLIAACEVLSEAEGTTTTTTDEPTTVVRRVVFRAGAGPGRGEVNEKGETAVEETCRLYAPVRVDFAQPDGSSISNVVSRGPDGELLMTYVFEWRHPDVAAGGPDEATWYERHEKVRVRAVVLSIFPPPSCFPPTSPLACATRSYNLFSPLGVGCPACPAFDSTHSGMNRCAGRRRDRQCQSSLGILSY